MSSMPDVWVSLDDAEVLQQLLAPLHGTGSDGAAVELSTKLLDASIRPRGVPENRVRLGSAVTYEELPGGTQRSVRLAVPRDADASAGRISVLSPVGRALLGHAQGQVISVALPMGRDLKIRLLDVAAPEFDAIEEPAFA